MPKGAPESGDYPVSLLVLLWCFLLRSPPGSPKARSPAALVPCAGALALLSPSH